MKEKNSALTPISLAAARAEAARKQKIDRSKYECVRTLDRLKAWIARAHEAGVVAVDTETTSLDAMQAGLCGFSLALSPNEACYVPIAHKKDGGGDGLFDAGLAPDQIKEADALKVLKPLLEDRSILKVGQNLKYDWLVFAQRGIEIEGYDDTMLISYVLDAGKGGHGMDDLAKRWLDHDTIHFHHVAGSGKSQVSFDCVAIDKATEYAAEDADVTLRLWNALKPRLAAEHVATVYETLERAMPAVLARMERRGISIDRQVLSRLSGEFAQKQGALEDEIKTARRRAAQSRLAQAARRHPVWQDGPARRHARRKPGNGRPARANWKTSPSRATRCRARFSTGGRCPSCARPIPRRCRLTSTRRPTACTRPTRSPPPRPDGCRRRSRICRTSRCAPRKAARSGAPLSPRPA